MRHEKTLRAARPGGEKPRILQLADETTEAQQVIADIGRELQKPGVEPSDFAILFRTNEQPRVFEEELRRARLPYTLIGGMSFYDRREVRDLLAYLKVLVQPHDEAALLRIINMPARGLSRQAVKALVDEAVKCGQPVWDVLPHASRLPDFSRPAIEGAAQFVDLIERFRRRLDRDDLVATVNELIQAIGYRREIERRYKDDVDACESRWSAIEEVVNSIAQYADRVKKPSLLGFLDEVMLTGREQDRDKEKKLGRNSIVLMTLHSAKGLEFPQVYLVGLEEGLLPHKRSVAVEAEGEADSIDEERRLCYVGITQAQERLTLSFALTRRKWGKPRPTQPSRFLFEVTGQADRPQTAPRRPHARPTANHDGTRTPSQPRGGPRRRQP